MTDYNERISVETHKGKEIYIIDYSKLMGDELIEMINKSEEYLEDKREFLIIFNLTQATVFGKALARGKEFAKFLKKHRKKSAFLGIEGPKKIILESILFFSGMTGSSVIKLFKTKAEAIDWLVLD